MGNLEGPAALGIDTEGRDHGDVGFTYDLKIYSGTNFSFNFHPRILGDLKKSGYDLLTGANNHALDRGFLGIDRTLEAAESVGIPMVGPRHSQDHAGVFYKIAEVNGLRIGFVACTEMTNQGPDRKSQLLYCYRDSEKIKALIGQLRSNLGADAVIVLPHWGQEYKSRPNDSQKKYARLFLEAGALAVIGSHPHVVQPWEKYVTSDGRETLILYSLGNFLAFQAGLEKKAGLVAYLGLVKSDSSGAQISGVAYTPTYRDGYEVFPLSFSKSSKDQRAHFTLNFGSLNVVEPSEALTSKLCH